MAKVSRQMLCASCLILVAAASPPPSNTGPQDFCSRLAAKSGIDKPSDHDGRTEWTVRALNFGQRFIFGGSSATGVGVAPVEPATVEDYHRLEDMCLPDGAGAICKLAGPVNFKFIWKGRKILLPMPAGEKAIVSVVGIKATCRSEI